MPSYHRLHNAGRIAAEEETRTRMLETMHAVRSETVLHVRRGAFLVEGSGDWLCDGLRRPFFGWSKK